MRAWTSRHLHCRISQPFSCTRPVTRYHYERLSITEALQPRYTITARVRRHDGREPPLNAFRSQAVLLVADRHHSPRPHLIAMAARPQAEGRGLNTGKARYPRVETR